MDFECGFCLDVVLHRFGKDKEEKTFLVNRAKNVTLPSSLSSAGTH
jgi:hypothetical protein